MTEDRFPAMSLWAKLVGRDASVVPRLAELAPWLLSDCELSETLASSLLSEVSTALQLSASEIRVLCRAVNAHAEQWDQSDSSCVPERSLSATRMTEIACVAGVSAGVDAPGVGHVSHVNTFEPTVFVPWIHASDRELIAALSIAARECPYFRVLHIHGKQSNTIAVVLDNDA
jgi:hypothetical protein